MVPSERYIVHQWPDGHVLFDLETGDTHALDPLSFASLMAAAGHPDPAIAIAEVILSSSSEIKDDTLERMTEECIERLTACGLIQSGNRN